MVTLRFSAGTVEIHDLPEGAALPSGCLFDERSACHRAPGLRYADIVRALTRADVKFIDEARRYLPLDENVMRVRREPRPYQSEALAAWKAARGRGVVVLPTGAGKTQVACMAIDDKKRSALVIAPTLDLVRQWFDLLRATFACPVGIVGGGEHDVQALTVTTYDSAYLHMEHLGARFGLAIFDECHHLPGATYSLGARLCIAPYRLGLTATPERDDGRDNDLDDLVGPVVYRKDIGELSGDYLAEYETERVRIALSPEERAEYESERLAYRTFVQQAGIRMASPSGWQDFIRMSSRSVEGRRAMAAYRRQRELALCAPAKLDYAAHLLDRHRGERTLVFTSDNKTAYEVSRRFLIPVITHQTRVRERSAILAGLADGTYGAVATSKVLNEGVDIPSASVAIVMSGSGSVREHVQRLGRILRKQVDKRAVLYELVTEATNETYTSDRRREHVAYR